MPLDFRFQIVMAVDVTTGIAW